MQSLESRNLVVLDVETTGVSPWEHDVLALAFVPLDPQLQPLRVYVSHPTTVNWTAFAKENFEKFREEWELHSVPPTAACEQIENYLLGAFGGEVATLIGHNVGFDIAYLRKLAFQGARSEIRGLSHRAVDTHSLLYVLMLKGQLPPEAVTSDGALKHFNISVALEARHTAYGDAFATRELFSKLLGMFDSS